jgi:Holliday junction resolvasome RuvABC endonuclease subunit
VKGPNAIGIDPGTRRLAFGVVDVWGSGKAKVFTLDNWEYPTLRALLKGLFVTGSAVAIEGQYLGVNPATTIKLARTRGFVEGVATELGYAVYEAAPATWHAHFKIKGPREARKDAASDLARTFLGPDAPTFNQDEADALCMATWLADEMRLAGSARP